MRMYGNDMTIDQEPHYRNSPLHGLSLKTMIEELVEHYGFQILHAYLDINCFNKNPSVASALKFLKKTDWARERVEGFYMYKFKGLPGCPPEQREMPPRDRVVSTEDAAKGLENGPAELSMEGAEEAREQLAKRPDRRGGRGNQPGSGRAPGGPWKNRSAGPAKPGGSGPWKNSRDSSRGRG